MLFHTWQDEAAFDAKVKAEDAAGIAVGVDASSDKQLVMFGTTKRNVARLPVAAWVLSQKFSLWIEHLDLPHAVVSNIEVTGSVEAHAVGLVIFPFTAGMFGQVGKDLHLTDFAGREDGIFKHTIELTFSYQQTFAIFGKHNSVGES